MNPIIHIKSIEEAYQYLQADMPPHPMIIVIRRWPKTELDLTLIDIKSVYNDPPSLPLSLLHALEYPMFPVFFIWQVIVDPTRILLWVIGVFILLIFLALGKFFKWLHRPPNPLPSLKLIQRQVKGELS